MLSKAKLLNKEKQQRAKEFRRKMTRAEKILWSNLRNNQLGGLHFRRQQVIAGFIIDYYCCRAKLIIEIDGGIHEFTQAHDEERARILKNNGFQILRIKNETIINDLPEALKSILDPCNKFSSND